MIRRIAFGCMILSAAPLAAQIPSTPAGACRAVGALYQSQTTAADRAASRTPDMASITAEARRRIRACADTLSRTRGGVPELSALAALDMYLGDTARARGTVT